MNQALQLRYQHANHTQVPRDVRKNRLPEVDWAHVYYVGFRIFTGGEDRYHHALIIADGYDTFLDGVAEEYNAIRSQSPATSFKDIALVFVRNLMMQDPEMMASAECQNITTEISEELSKRDDNQYLVFGLVGEERICLVKVSTGDALLAIEFAQRSVLEKHQKEFMPLEVCQAHPVTAECYALFDAAAERIKSLVSGELTGSGYLH